MEGNFENLMLAPARPTAVEMPSIENLVADWLNLDVANGDACADTLLTYQGHFEGWLTWCASKNIHPSRVSVEEVKAWRQELIGDGLKTSTVALKLTTVRRFYQSRFPSPLATTRSDRDSDQQCSLSLADIEMCLGGKNYHGKEYYS